MSAINLANRTAKLSTEERFSFSLHSQIAEAVLACKLTWASSIYLLIFVLLSNRKPGEKTCENYNVIKSSQTVRALSGETASAAYERETTLLMRYR